MVRGNRIGPGGTQNMKRKRRMIERGIVKRSSNDAGIVSGLCGDVRSGMLLSFGCSGWGDERRKYVVAVSLWTL